jgi:hypothetical protein
MVLLRLDLTLLTDADVSEWRVAAEAPDFQGAAGNDCGKAKKFADQKSDGAYHARVMSHFACEPYPIEITGAQSFGDPTTAELLLF